MSYCYTNRSEGKFNTCSTVGDSKYNSQARMKKKKNERKNNIFFSFSAYKVIKIQQ